jgi:Transposase family tnp2
MKKASNKSVMVFTDNTEISVTSSNERDVKLLRWHDECRKEDDMLIHPTDSPKWRNINREWPDFDGEVRNLRLELYTNKINSYENMSRSHSIWYVLLCVYNLPPWLCMKRKYMSTLELTFKSWACNIKNNNRKKRINKAKVGDRQRRVKGGPPVRKSHCWNPKLQTKSISLIWKSK